MVREISNFKEHLMQPSQATTEKTQCMQLIGPMTSLDTHLQPNPDIETKASIRNYVSIWLTFRLANTKIIHNEGSYLFFHFSPTALFTRKRFNAIKHIPANAYKDESNYYYHYKIDFPSLTDVNKGILAAISQEGFCKIIGLLA